MAVYADTNAECRRLCDRIRMGLAEGTTRFRAERGYRRIKEEVEQYRLSCSAELADYFDIAVDQLFSKESVDITIARCERLITDSSNDLATWYALALRARLTAVVESLRDNAKPRAKALQIALSNGWNELVVVTLANWAFLALLKDDIEVASRKLREAEDALQTLPAEIRDNDQTIIGIRARLVAHAAKVRIRRAIHQGAVGPDIINETDAAYEEVCAIISEYDHMRTNYMIEWADELTRLHREAGAKCLSSVERTLGKATTSLDSHVCDLCRGYFHQVRGAYLAEIARDVGEMHPSEALDSWDASRAEGETSYEFFAKTAHPYTRFASEIIERAKMEIAKLSNPDRIFLSHKGSDKELARRFKTALGSLGYKPWLDEDALTAGMALDRALLNGMKESCGAVFFITPDFEDAGYLAVEIDYAVAEQRTRGHEFAIVTLVFQDAAGRVGTVPDLLHRFVWKKPASELDGLVEIVRALPLTLPPPRWP